MEQLVMALGWLEWPLRCIGQARGVRQETAGARRRMTGCMGRRATVKPANEVIIDFGGHPPGNQGFQSASQDPSACACEPYREAIELGLSRRRNAMAIWRNMVSDYGFASGYQTVRRFIRKLRGSQLP